MGIHASMAFRSAKSRSEIKTDGNDALFFTIHFFNIDNAYINLSALSLLRYVNIREYVCIVEVIPTTSNSGIRYSFILYVASIINTDGKFTDNSRLLG